MRSIVIAASLAAAIALAGCGLSDPSTAPLEPAPTPGVSEAPARVVDLAGSKGNFRMSLRVFDRALSLTEARSATAAELAGSERILRDGAIAAAELAGGRQVLVLWPGRTCPETGNLFIGPGVAEVIIVPSVDEACEPMSNVRGVVLGFKLPVDLEAIEFDVRPAP
jgi:hypothetical protein